MSNITKEIALAYHKAGFHIVPVGPDKRPLCKWKQYQTAQSREDVEKLFQTPSWGLAALTGINGLECIDVDEKYDLNGDLFLRYQKINDTYSEGSIAFPYLTVCSTMNGGYHIFYRCKAIQGNQKLAMRPATPEELAKHNEKVERKITDPNRIPQVLVETRGQGGYVIITPTPGYSVEYGAMKSIPEITQEQRFALLTNARRFDEVEVQQSDIDKLAKSREYKPSSGMAPYEEFNLSTDIIDLLQSYGWTEVYEDSARVHLLRPGDASTKTSGNYHKGLNLFICHSTSTPLPSEKGLTAAAIYTYYEHQGDFKAATRDLAAKGFGSQDFDNLPESEQTPEQQEKAKEQKKDLLAFVKSTKFDIRKPIKEEDAILTSKIDGKVYKLAGRGMIGSIVGEQKSGKSLITSCFTASGLSGKDVLTFNLDLQGGNGIFFDTEQPEFFFSKTQQRIHKMAKLYDNSDNYEAYMLRRLNVKERVQVINELLQGRKDLTYIVIDGIVDLCEDFNSERHSKETIEHLMRWSDETGALIITVLHLTKSQGFMRGHLGTELQNKHDFSLQVTQDKEQGIYAVKPRDSRFAPFPGFEFFRDENGYPVLDMPEQPEAMTEDDYMPRANTSTVQKKADINEELPF